MATRTTHTHRPPDSKSHATHTRTCLCSPTTHPGSFRCSLHRNSPWMPTGRRATGGRVAPLAKWELAVIDKANSFRAFLLQVIKPSSHDLQRRRNFRPRPSRFCLLNGGGSDGVAVS